jgi:hypothetical protein
VETGGSKDSKRCGVRISADEGGEGTNLIRGFDLDNFGRVPSIY